MEHLELEYESVAQSEAETCVDNALSRKLTISSKRLSSARRFLRLPDPFVFFVASVGLVGIATIIGVIKNYVDQQDRENQSALTTFATKAFIEAKHGKIPTIFFNPPSRNDVTCADYINTQGRECISDRLGNGEALSAHLLLCSEGGRYLFGLDDTGSLIWRDCRDNIERRIMVYHRCTKDCFFMLTENASFVLMDGSAAEGAARYEKQCQLDVSPTEACLDDPRYDCPYIHLHGSGKLVLHYVDGKGEAKQKNAEKIYSFDSGNTRRLHVLV